MTGVPRSVLALVADGKRRASSELTFEQALELLARLAALGPLEAQSLSEIQARAPFCTDPARWLQSLQLRLVSEACLLRQLRHVCAAGAAAGRQR